MGETEQPKPGHEPAKNEERDKDEARRLEKALASLNPEVRETVMDAIRGKSWRGHPVDMRLSLPAPLGRAYLTLVAGRERRDPERLREERRRILTVGNVLFVLGVASLFYMLAIFALFLHGAVLAF